jgi:hypothetical protein
MHITINDQALPADFSHLGNLEEILSEIHAKYLPPGEQLYQVHLNGRFFSERYPRESRYLTREEIERLEVKTLPAREMARVILREAAAQAEVLARAVAECARLFRLAPEQEAHRVLAEVLEALRWLLQTGVGGGQVLQGGSADLSPEMAHICRHLELLLTDMEDQTRQGDCIMLADLMEYELLPLVEQWSRLLLTMACG